MRLKNPGSARAYAEGREHLFGGVPMTWMNKAAGRFPLYLDRARGSRVTDIDGHEYVDFSLGDTAAMAGHSPPAVAYGPCRPGKGRACATSSPGFPWRASTDGRVSCRCGRSVCR